MDMSVDESMSSNYYKDTPTRCKDNRRTLLYAAQKGMYEKRLKSPRTFSVLPTYGPATPGHKVYNPFKTDVELLEKPTCSPTIFTKTISSETGEFTWSIDDISRINPAPIDSPVEIPEEKCDLAEETYQAAIQRYFQNAHNVDSPLSGIGQWVSPAPSATPVTSSSTPFHGKSHRVQDESTQTALSLPPVLPPELEEILQQYYLKTEDLEGNDDGNLSGSNSSLRRKLFFNQEEEFLSPVKKVCLEGDTPIEDNSMKATRLDWNFQDKTEVFSSPDVSPIKFKPEPMSISVVKEGIFTSTIMCGSMDTGYSTMEQWKSNELTDNNHS